MANKIIEIAQELYDELDTPSDLSISSIKFWLESNFALLNNYLDTSFSLKSSGATDPAMENKEKVILKKIYLIYYYDKKARSALKTASTDSVISVTSDGATVRRQNRTEISRTYFNLKKEEKDELHRLIHAYKWNNYQPVQVAGDDGVTLDVDGNEIDDGFNRVF